jgi:RNA polymerase sigma-70 factor (ECF subfamily)
MGFSWKNSFHWTLACARPPGQDQYLFRENDCRPWKLGALFSQIVPNRWTARAVAAKSPFFMAIDFSAATGAPDEAGETRNVRLPAAAPVLEPGAPTDLELMHGIQAEDPEALSALYDRYNGIIKALILRVIHNEAEADDLLQEIFMEIWNQAKNFSAQKGKPLGWMVTLARRRAIDGLRKKQAYARAGERLQTETEQQPDAWVHNATEEEISFSDTRVLVRRVIGTLPVAQQQAINLAFFRGMSQREIAAKTNTPLGTVKTRLELGLKKIYDGLKELRDEL